MDWHDKSCKRLDLAVINDIRSCVRCGSFEATNRALLPPIRQRTEIRILHVRPGSYEDDIVCDISTRDLSSRPEYEALSYTWATESGDVTKRKTISISGLPFPVTQNCDNALRRIRHRYSVRDIWIDALCIDQHDTAERGHQVQLMHRIYAEATRVLIYIGEADRSSDTLLDILSSGIYEKHRFGSLLAAEQLLFSRRYFHRVWVIQEVALARSAILICGEKQLSWSSFRRWCLMLEPTDLQVLRIPPLLHIDHRTYASPNQLLRLLDLSRDFMAADPRDKVYAILGLIIDADTYNLDVDYNVSVEELYTKIALQIAVRHGWAAVLRRAGTEQRRLQSLPSWVPDWSDVYSQNMVPPLTVQFQNIDSRLALWCMLHVEVMCGAALTPKIRGEPGGPIGFFYRSSKLMHEYDEFGTPSPPYNVWEYLKEWVENKRAPCPLSEMPELMAWYQQPSNEAETAWLKVSSEVNGSPIRLLESMDLSALSSLTWKLLHNILFKLFGVEY
ncbi:hypothetical protein DL771_005895 [Monosporascus sp. 5C6A]|nr:hypothetical protein DL771_005895 [Monosporascus sp. 5C6A]